PTRKASAPTGKAGMPGRIRTAPSTPSCEDRKGPRFRREWRHRPVEEGAMRWLRLARVVLTVMLVFSNPAGATWQVGDVITYPQESWGDPGSNAGSLVFNY